MEVVRWIVIGAAGALVALAYARWVAERLDHDRGRLAPDRDMLLLYAPMSVGGLAVALVCWSFAAGALFATIAFFARRIANEVVREVRWLRSRRPSTPEARQRRLDARNARRRARARALELYGTRVP